MSDLVVNPVTASLNKDGACTQTFGVDIQPATSFPAFQYKWNTKEEIYAILIAKDKHEHWLNQSVACRPTNGSMLLYNKNTVVNYRKDGYVWKKRKDKKFAREDHMKLRIRGCDAIYGSYAHSAILPSFHRRVYWLLECPNIILAHYLNAPSEEKRNILPNLNNCDKRRWAPEELFHQIQPMYAMPSEPDMRKICSFEPMSDECLRDLVDKLLAGQRQHADGVQVTAQWVLNLNNTGGGYLVSTESQPQAIQIQNGSNVLPRNFKFVLGTIQHPPAAGGPSQSNDARVTKEASNLVNNSNTLTDLQQQPPTLQHQQLVQHQQQLQQHSHSIATSHSSLGNLNTHHEVIDTGQNTSSISHDLFNHELSHSHTQCQTLAAKPEPLNLIDAVDSVLQCPMDTTHASTDDNEHHSDLVLPSPGEFLMSEEDIHSTLSANMPTGERNQESHSSTDFQLEAFDLFSDWGTSKLVDQSAHHQQQAPAEANHSQQWDGQCRQQRVKMTALAPEWSYSEGGCKVLLVGPWKASDNAQFTCVFGTQAVNAEVVQDGVLSCITPAHDEGVVYVQVALDGHLISDGLTFEFRHRKYEPSRYRAWFVCEESRLQMSLLNRLQMIEACLEMNFHQPPLLNEFIQLEQRIIILVNSLLRCKWKTTGTLPSTLKALTLLHLSAGLGLKNLIQTLIHWKQESPNDILNQEVCGTSQDENGCTPLHWSCARGQMDAAVALYNYDQSSLDIVNKDGMSPLSLARAFGYQKIVQRLEQNESAILDTMLDNSLAKSNHSKPVNSRRSASPVRSPTTPHYQVRRQSSLSVPVPTLSHGMRLASSDPVLTSVSTPDEVMTSTPVFHQLRHLMESEDHSEHDDEDSFVDIETISDNESSSVVGGVGDPHTVMMKTLAEQIIAAMPDRIKSTTSDSESSVPLMNYRERSSSRSSYSSVLSCADDSGVCTPLTADWTQEDSLRCKLSCSPGYSPESLYNHSGASYAGSHNHSSGATPSSHSYGIRSESPPVSTEMLGEYFNAGTHHVMHGLSQLTLSDTEQRKLYQAARVIQNAFRQFKDKKQQQKEIEAAIIIQTYYRRFKEFTTFHNVTKLQQAATRIQSQFRSYYAQKRFKKSKDAALLIQHHYRAYKEHEQFKRSRNAAVLIQQKFRTHYHRKKNTIPENSISSSSAQAPRGGVRKSRSEDSYALDLPM